MAHLKTKAAGGVVAAFLFAFIYHLFLRLGVQYAILVYKIDYNNYGK